MSKTFHLDIVTPTKMIDMGEVSYLRVPGVDGLFGIMASHTNAIFAVAVGELKVVKDDRDEYYATSKGYAEVTRDKVQLLVESVERSDEIDLKRAEEALKRAKEKLKEAGEEIDRTRVEFSVLRASNRMKIAKKR